MEPTEFGKPVSSGSWERETAALSLEQVASEAQVETLQEGVLANASVRAVRVLDWDEVTQLPVRPDG